VIGVVLNCMKQKDSYYYYNGNHSNGVTQEKSVRSPKKVKVD
jgi:hypothetical protein